MKKNNHLTDWMVDKGDLPDKILILKEAAEDYQNLAPGEEAALLERAARGDRDARNRLVRTKIGMVINLAKKYNRIRPGTPDEDLVSEGLCSLMDAIDKFDLSRRNKFSTYAYKVIENRIKTVNRESYKFKGNGDGDKNGQGNTFCFVSLDEPLEDDQENCLYDITPAEDPHEIREREGYEFVSETIRDALMKLDDQERQVIWLHMGFNGGEAMDLREVANRCGISYNRAYNLKKSATLKLWPLLKKHDLDKF